MIIQDLFGRTTLFNYYLMVFAVMTSIENKVGLHFGLLFWDIFHMVSLFELHYLNVISSINHHTQLSFKKKIICSRHHAIEWIRTIATIPILTID